MRKFQGDCIMPAHPAQFYDNLGKELSTLYAFFYLNCITHFKDILGEDNRVLEFQYIEKNSIVLT